MNMSPTFFKKQRPGIMTFLAGIIFLIFSYIAGPTVLEWFLVVKNPIKKADALILMAGSREHRLPAVVQLYRQGVASTILLANDGVRGAWSEKHNKNLYLVEWAGEYLLDQGVRESAIKRLGFIKSGSYYDALNVRNYVLAHKSIRSLLVVTSDYHTRRTLWVFERLFADMDIIIGVYPVAKDPNYKGRHLKAMSLELVKLFYYQVRYGLFSHNAYP